MSRRSRIGKRRKKRLSFFYGRKIVSLRRETSGARVWLYRLLCVLTLGLLPLMCFRYFPRLWAWFNTRKCRILGDTDANFVLIYRPLTTSAPPSSSSSSSSSLASATTKSPSSSSVPSTATAATSSSNSKKEEEELEFNEDEDVLLPIEVITPPKKTLNSDCSNNNSSSSSSSSSSLSSELQIDPASFVPFYNKDYDPVYLMFQYQLCRYRILPNTNEIVPIQFQLDESLLLSITNNMKKSGRRKGIYQRRERERERET